MAVFRARARALDMLGRQQIAGVPTAINELFKNAYDAYATRVEGHLIRPANLLLIRDNGFGMTLDDFLNKWLVIGTESKFQADLVGNDMYRPKDMPRRPTAGEKGIGRLAIGILGAQTFVWTKAERDGVLCPAVVAFVNWAAFGIPNVDLGDIELPVKEIERDEYPTDELLGGLVSEFKSSLQQACKGKSTRGEEEQVYADLDQCGRGIATWLTALEDSQFGPTKSGTVFLIQPVGPTVLDTIDTDNRGASRVVKELAGFSNTMAASAESRVITPAFWDHRGDGDSTDILGEAEFWTEQDFASADHEIKGTVDNFGTFKGKIRIFHNAPTDHIVPFKSVVGHKTECGPFEIALGVVQGVQRESSLDPDLYALMQRRLERFAGVYVYRDSLRVLPYGRHDQDWLGIEERRTRHASYYFFSHRRMFGYVAVTRQLNAGLKEKAGREGFQENRAYKQMREILEQMLVQLAADFFRGNEEEPTVFRLGLKENDRLNRARTRHDRSKGKKLKAFRQSMQQVDSLLNDEILEQSIQELVQGVQSSVATITPSLDPQEVVQRLITCESDANAELNSLWKNLDFSKPRGIAIGKNLERAYEIVADRRNKVEADLFTPARQQIHGILREAAQEAGFALNQRLRVTALLERETATALRETKRQVTAARTASQDVAMRVAILSDSIVQELDQRLRAIQVGTNNFAFDTSSEEDVDRYLSQCRHEVSLATEFLSSALLSMTDIFRSMEIEWDPDTGLVSSLDEKQILDEEVEELREQADSELELAQLGLSIDIINHEFLGTINAIRKGLRSLDSWADINPDMDTLRNVLKNNFNHLENFLNLFTPLRKRFNAEKTSIRGTEVLDYLNSIFLERLKGAKVDLKGSEEFRNKRVLSFASVILPAFTNIVDNALFWLRDQPEPRIVELAVDGSDWLISDNGPGIPTRYHASVFAAGFTTRPGGRGLGLYVARQVLDRHGFTLTIEDIPRLGRGTTFRISIKKEVDDD